MDSPNEHRNVSMKRASAPTSYNLGRAFWKGFIHGLERATGVDVGCILGNNCHQGVLQSLFFNTGEDNVKYIPEIR